MAAAPCGGIEPVKKTTNSSLPENLSPTLNCPFAGTYRVKPKVKTEKLILWIYDPESVGASKLNHTAIIPSQSSQILGRLFWNLGQEPVVHIYLKKEKYYSQEHPKLGGFFFGEFTSGVMAVELQPSIFENACKLQHQVSYFYVGCPPGRHMVVERKFLWNPTDEDQIAYFDWDKYGCPMELHYEEYFQPVISLQVVCTKHSLGP
ncbi:cation channel sperm-associated auxiliary subunit epsilon [Spheniscus humboldti]